MSKTDHAARAASLKMAGAGEQDSTIDWRCIMPQLKTMHATATDQVYEPQHNFRAAREHMVDFESRFLNSFNDDFLDRWHDQNLLSMNDLRFDDADSAGG